MEVTRKNFKETLPLVADSIDKADFLVIDAEFTGLINGREVSVFDSPEEYYYTLLNGASDFLLIQFGLCAFYWDETEKHYMNDAYNFYLFPRGRPGPERMFLCQSSSLDFLAAQGFDFNKLIKEGISYMSEPCETRLRENLLERQKSYTNDSHINIPEENKQQIEEICKRVREFLDEKKSDEMEIDRCNAFIRRLLFQELGTKFKNEAFVETKVLENKNRVLKVSRITAENDGKNRDTLKKEKEWEEFEDAVGFSKVARMISQSEKLVIGHNMLLDLIHTLNHFFQPLPADYGTFKEFVHCMFPKLLDTKYMSSLPPFKDKVSSNVLSHLLATLSEPPFSLPKAVSEEGRGYSRADDKAHEAGYDAYVTGLCFLSMLAHLASMRGEPLARATTHQAVIKPFLNKVFLAKTAHQSSPYMNLTGADPNPPRDHVFHLTFPKEWTRNDINQLFSPFCAITMQFLDDTSALVALSRREQARDVQRALSGHSRVAIVPYMRYKLAAKMPLKDQDRSSEYKRDFAAIPNAYTSDSSPKPRKVNFSGMKQKLPEKVDRPKTERPPAESPKVDRPQMDKFKVDRSKVDKSKVDRPKVDRSIVDRPKVDKSKADKSKADKPQADKPQADKPQADGPLVDISQADSSKVNRPQAAILQVGRSQADTPQKERQESNNVSLPSPPRTGRKRTSSGMFQVDDAEPPPKKIELVRSHSDSGRKKPDTVTNGRGRRKTADSASTAKKETDGQRETEKKIVEKFDAGAKSNCVSAFKESDSWD